MKESTWNDPWPLGSFHVERSPVHLILSLSAVFLSHTHGSRAGGLGPRSIQLADGPNL